MYLQTLKNTDTHNHNHINMLCGQKLYPKLYTLYIKNIYSPHTFTLNAVIDIHQSLKDNELLKHNTAFSHFFVSISNTF